MRTLPKTLPTNFAPLLPALCESLRAADPDIVALVQFGSSVYAPECALDFDLLVVTRQKKDYGVYLDAAVGFPLQVDVIPVEAGEKLEPHLALGVRATGRLLWGDLEAVERMVTDVAVPTFDEARRELPMADRYAQLANAETDSFARQVHWRNAFNMLFDAARLAAMCYLDTEETRWDELRRQLPSPFDERFRQIVNNCHIAFFYRRMLPLVDIDAEYQKWRDEVLNFINDLEAAKGA